MTTPSPLPEYLYKIVPQSDAPPSPLPLALPLSPLDAGDKFIHLSTSSQILGTLRLFFSSDSLVYILRIPYERVDKWIKWEDTKGNPPDGKVSWDVKSAKGFFPHIHGNSEDGGLKLGREEVLDVGVWNKGDGDWESNGWPFEKDIPE